MRVLHNAVVLGYALADAPAPVYGPAGVTVTAYAPHC